MGNRARPRVESLIWETPLEGSRPRAVPACPVDRRARNWGALLERSQPRGLGLGSSSGTWVSRPSRTPRMHRRLQSRERPHRISKVFARLHGESRLVQSRQLLQLSSTVVAASGVFAATWACPECRMLPILRPLFWIGIVRPAATEGSQWPCFGLLRVFLRPDASRPRSVPPCFPSSSSTIAGGKKPLTSSSN